MGSRIFMGDPGGRCHRRCSRRLLSPHFCPAHPGGTVGTGRCPQRSLCSGRSSWGPSWARSLIFRLYVPVGLVLWNAKDPEARKRTIPELLRTGSSCPRASKPKRESSRSRRRPAPSDVEAGGFQASAASPATPPSADAAPVSTAASAAPMTTNALTQGADGVNRRRNRA